MRTVLMVAFAGLPLVLGGGRFAELAQGGCSGGEDTPTPAPIPEVALNEVQCSGTDYVEVVNVSASEPANLSGWILTQDPSNPEDRYVIPEGTEIGPSGRLLLYSSDGNSPGLPFGLSCGDESVWLLNPDFQEIDSVQIPALGTQNSWGRLPDRLGVWQEGTPTPGYMNQPPGTLSDPEAWLYNPFQVITVDLQLSEESISALDADPYTYVDGTFYVTTDSDVTAVMTVGVRLKGQYGSFRTLDQKAAFKVKFNEYIPEQRFFGLKRMTLNNMVQDPSMIHEVLAYSIFRESGITCPRTGYAWVRVNGEDYGLYTDIETMDNIALEAHYPTTQHLYEGAYGVDLYPEHVPYFDVDEGDEVDRTDLQVLTTAVTSPEDAAWLSQLEPLTDLEEFLRSWAAEIYTGHWDGYAYGINNYFLHSTAEGRFTLQPWGIDQTFGYGIPYTQGNGYMFVRCMGISECRDRYITALNELLPVVDSLDLDTQAISLLDFLYPWIEADPRKEYSTDTVEANVQATRDFMSWRRTDAETWLACEIEGDCPECSELWRGSHRYLVCPYAVPYADARARCQAEGADMAILGDSAENAWLATAAVSVGYFDGWIGLTDEAEEGSFVWWDGSIPTWVGWASGEPNDWYGEDCTQMYSDGRWNDLYCDASLPAFCEDICPSGEDRDNDGYSRCTADCNDDDPSIYPTAPEVCADGIDQDCSGVPDDGGCP